MITATSIAAHKVLKKAPIRDRILEILADAGSRGCVSDEILCHFPSDMKTGSINGRYSELERDGLIFRDGERVGFTGRMQTVWKLSIYSPTAIKPIAVSKKNPFIEGIKYAAKLIIASSDLNEAKRKLHTELSKAVKR